MDILVSAIITTHNRLEYLKHAIDSVLSQTYSNLECIVVSDNSNDGTNEYCRNISGIKFISISNIETRGGNHARNVGINASNGDFVAFLDDDDTWMPDKIEKQIHLAKEKRTDFVYCMRVFDFTNREGVRWTCNENIEDCPEGDLSKKIFQHYVSSTSCYLIKKSLLEAIGCFDEKVKMWQDYDLMIRCAQNTSIYFVKEFLVSYTLIESDKAKVSNNFNNCPRTLRYLAIKYEKLLLKYGVKTRLYFYDSIIKEIHYRAEKYNNFIYKFTTHPWIWVSYRLKLLKWK